MKPTESVLLSLLSVLLPAILSAQPMSGTYPIGPGGPGVDSFATVQAAANALSARGLGGDADFPIAAGTYAGPVTLRGIANSAGHATVFRSEQAMATIDAAGGSHAFAVESTDNVTLARLRFIGARGGGSAGVRFTDSDNGRVVSGRFGDSADVGILAERCDSLRLDSIRVEGVLAGPGSRGVELRECRAAAVNRCSIPGTVGTGMYVSGGSDVSVYRMAVMDPLEYGLRLENTVRGRFERCFTHGTPGYGIHAVGARGAYLDSCTVNTATVAAAYFEECDSLTFLIPMIVGNPERGFWLTRSEACTVRVLSIMGQPVVGMYFDRAPGCVVESTQVMGMDADSGYALLVDSSPGTAFTFFQAVGNFRRGILVNRSDGVRFRHARLRGTVSEAGMAIDGSSGVRVWTCSLNVTAVAAGAGAVVLSGASADDTLLGMTVLAETEHGIRAGSGAERLVVASNYLSGWTGEGVVLDGAASPRLYYNTVVSPEAVGAAGFRFRDVTGAEARDNIVWNRGLDSSACLRVEGGFPFATGASDYNDLYASGTNGSTARVNDTLYQGLEDWRAHGSAPDGHSLAQDPLFDSVGDFHLAPGSPCRDSGTPVPGVTVDLDGDERDPVTPDIGADEFGPGALVESPARPSLPLVAVAGNPAGGSCRLTYALPRPADVRLRLIDVLGREVLVRGCGRAAAGRHELELDLSGAVPGVYVLELEAGSHRAALKLVRR